MSIEERLNKIRYFSDNLIVLSRGLSDIYPEAEGAILSVGTSIREETDKILNEYFEELRYHTTS